MHAFQLSIRLIVLVCLLVFQSKCLLSQGGQTDAFRVIGYLPEYRIADFDASQLDRLTDLILFSAEAKTDGQIDMSKLLSYKNWQEWTSSGKVKTRFHLCVGGWGRSEHFAGVASSNEKRARFVQEAVSICKTYRLSGLDLDWEHPKNIEEQNSYALLIKDLKLAFAKDELSLSVTIAAWQHLSKEAYLHADRVHIMAYDHPGKHSTLEGAKQDVKLVVKQGSPIEKIVLGLPFYGRSTINGNDSLTYREIVEKHRLEKTVDQVGDVYFNGPQTIQSKTMWALDNHLAGVMVWEVGQDATGDQSLLQLIQKTVKR